MDNIRIQQYLEYNESEIIALYTSVGWKNYYENQQMLKQSYEHSLYVLGAYINDNLIGIIRVVGDGYSIIYIQDIIVLPIYQQKGIGSLLLKSILEKYTDVYQKVLLTDNQPKTIKFYESIGFKSADKFGCIGFINFAK